MQYLILVKISTQWYVDMVLIICHDHGMIGDCKIQSPKSLEPMKMPLSGQISWLAIESVHQESFVAHV